MARPVAPAGPSSLELGWLKGRAAHNMFTRGATVGKIDGVAIGFIVAGCAVDRLLVETRSHPG